MANVSSLPPAGSADPHHDVKFLIGSLNAILQYANGTGNVNFYMVRALPLSARQPCEGAASLQWLSWALW